MCNRPNGEQRLASRIVVPSWIAETLAGAAAGYMANPESERGKGALREPPTRMVGARGLEPPTQMRPADHPRGRKVNPTLDVGLTLPRQLCSLVGYVVTARPAASGTFLT